MKGTSATLPALPTTSISSSILYPMGWSLMPEITLTFESEESRHGVFHFAALRQQDVSQPDGPAGDYLARLAPADSAAAGDIPAGNSDVGSVPYSFYQRWDDLGRVLQVGIHDDNGVCGRHAEAINYRRGQAFFILAHHDPGRIVG